MELDELLEHAFTKKASDIHISPECQPLLRINGDLFPIEGSAFLYADDTKRIIYSALSEKEQEKLENNLELDFSYTISALGGFRGNAYYTRLGLSAAFRLIPDVIPSLDQIGIPAVLKRLVEYQNGLILVTGPTGSGKSTTLASMLNYINQNQSKHIVTIEDPIEFTHLTNKSLINQRQLKAHTKKFSSALRAALREDPDIIFLGEMRDLETIRLALTAAETGHLVLSTLHTSSAPRAINRIIDVFNPNEKLVIRNMLSESLRGVISQTLVHSSLGGRVAAFEVMLGTPAIRNLIREDKIAQMYSVIQTNANIGMCTLSQYLNDLFHKKIITEETLNAYSDHLAEPLLA